MPNPRHIQNSILLATLLLVLTGQLFATTRPINYQGFLTEPDGTPIDTPVTLVISLWSDAIAGTLLYSESHTSVVVSKGRFSVGIGTGTPVSGTFDADQFRQDSWLELTVNGELLSPRSQVGAVASAQHSEIAERLATTCPDGQWLGFANGVLSCYACSSGDSLSCYDGDPATRDIGNCKSGIRMCTDGAYGACGGQVLPDAEICNVLDDDCNGLVDDGSSLPGCVDLYVDSDGDGFGDTALLSCLCNDPPVPNRSAVGGDCDDGDSATRPDQTLFFTSPNNLGSFDYNCNGTIEKSYTIGLASCTFNGNSCDYVAGFKNTIPGCGEIAALSNGCSLQGTTCSVTNGIIGLTMGCR